MNPTDLWPALKEARALLQHMCDAAGSGEEAKRLGFEEGVRLATIRILTVRSQRDQLLEEKRADPRIPGTLELVRDDIACVRGLLNAIEERLDRRSQTDDLGRRLLVERTALLVERLAVLEALRGR